VRALAAAVAVAALAAPAAARADETIQAAPRDRFTADTVTLAGGEGLTFQNLDVDSHNVTSTAAGPDGRPLFASATIGGDQSAPVEGVKSLPAGSYDFVCTLHPFMKGRLVVQGGGGAAAPGGGQGGGAGPDETPPDLRVGLVAARSTRRAAVVRVVLDEPATVTLVARAGRRVVGRARVSLGRGARRIRVALRRAGAGRVSVRASALDAAGNEAVAAASGRLRA